MKEQTLVLLSSVMTWVNTPRKPKKAGEGEDSENEDDYFTDKDFNLRTPSPRYQQIKTIETMAMAA